MTLEVRGQNIEVSNALRDHIARRLHYALGRFEGRVTGATARLADLNGPRGGVDKRCRIIVAMRAQEPILVEDTDTDVYAAVDRASKRAGRAVWRQLERRREIDVRQDTSKSA